MSGPRWWREWRHAFHYHANGNGRNNRHARMPEVRRTAGGTLVLERTQLPRKAFWFLIAVSALVMYILIFGGVL